MLLRQSDIEIGSSITTAILAFLIGLVSEQIAALLDGLSRSKFSVLDACGDESPNSGAGN